MEHFDAIFTVAVAAPSPEVQLRRDTARVSDAAARRREGFVEAATKPAPPSPGAETDTAFIDLSPEKKAGAGSTYTALFNCEGDGEDELTFSKGDRLVFVVRLCEVRDFAARLH